MKTFVSSSLLAFFLTFLASTYQPVSAQVLYDNGDVALGSPDGYGYFADANDPYYVETGNVFTPTQSGTAGTISFGGIFYGGTPDVDNFAATNTFTLSLYSVSGNAPGSLIKTSTLSGPTIATVGLGASEEVYEITGDLTTPFTLNTGTAYYLGISDLSDPSTDFAVAVTVNPTAATNGYTLLAGTSTFAGYTDSLSFKLSVPEPGEGMLVLLGGLALVLVRKSRVLLS